MGRNVAAIIRVRLASGVMLAGLVGCIPEMDGVSKVVQFEGKESGWTHSQPNAQRPLSYFYYLRGQLDFKFDPETRRAIYNKDDYMTDKMILESKKSLVAVYKTPEQLKKYLKFEQLECDEKCSRRSCAWLASFLSGKDIRMSPKVCATISYVPDSCFPKMKDDCVSVTDFTREY